MLADAQVPASCATPHAPAVLDGVPYAAVRWTPEGLERLVAALRQAGPGLRAIPRRALLSAWGTTVEAFLDPASPERRALEPALARLCRLSPAGLAAGLAAVLGGVRRRPAAAQLARADSLRAGQGPGGASGQTGQGPGASGSPDLVVAVLASNLPALAVQPLLPALALRRPVLLKSPSAEPLFAPAFVAALICREPRLAGAVAALTWPGGDQRLERPVLAAAGTVLAYGEEAALADLGRRAPGRVVGYGPKTSVGVVGADAGEAAAGLARDVALFDQRGCLSIAAIYTDGDALELARRLEEALAGLARRWPPGPLDPTVAAAVQQLRLEAALRGLAMSELPVAEGTVIVEPEPAFRPSPGLRTVRVHPLAGLDGLPALLAPWGGRLQGAALAGEDAWRLESSLLELGISRCARPGELQSPDASWHNGGVDPLLALAEGMSGSLP
ncbi:MAG TPA: acyl-CoA reductase [Thermoanaerobaculia bacterium]|nr:acyl-CoA reductase [Thermoanaerobaculia bacterium]